MSQDTCVYIHTRSDNIVFYVGIGTPKRPYSEKARNQHWHNTTSKYAYTVTILHQNLTWDQACAIEIELIKKYRELSGDKLCNVTEGGEGTKGVKCRLGHKATPETRAKLSTALKGNTIWLGKTHSEETRKKLRDFNKGKVLSEEHRARMGASRKGRVHSDETRIKLSAAAKNRPPISEETRAKISAAAKNISEETRAKMRAAQRARFSINNKFLLAENNVEPT